MRRWLPTLAALLISVSLIALVLVRYRPWELWELTPVFGGKWVLALGLDALLVVIWAHRHAACLSGTGYARSPRSLYGLVTFANAASNVTPAATSELVRGWILSRRMGVPVPEAAAAILFERVYMFALLSLTAGGAIVGQTISPLASLVVIVGGLAILSGVVLLLRSLARRSGRLSIQGQTESVDASPKARWGRLRKTSSLVTDLAKDKRLLAKVGLLSLAAFTLMTTLFLLAASEFSFSISPIEAWAVVGGATVVGVLSLLPFGLGAAEWSGVGIAVLLGIDPNLVAAAFLIYRLFFTVPVAIAGSLVLIRFGAPTVAGDGRAEVTESWKPETDVKDSDH